MSSPDGGNAESAIGKNGQGTGKNKPPAHSPTVHDPAVPETGISPSRNQKSPIGAQPEHNGLTSGDAVVVSQEDLEALDLWHSLSPELQQVVRSLPTLPDELKAAILALVKASTGTK